MINFRYHIVSLMAVFLALSVGIAVGVTLRPSVDEGLAQQAAQDRRQVQELRTELDRRNALDEYSNAWATRSRPVLLPGTLSGERVGVIAMPDAPRSVIEAVSDAVDDAGGSVTRRAQLTASAFDPAQEAEVAAVLQPWADTLGLAESTSTATRFGAALSRAMLASGNGDGAVSASISRALTRAGLVSIDDDGELAELAIMVTAEAPEPVPTAAVLEQHIDVLAAVKRYAVGLVVAGPNSDGVEGSDVLALRRSSASDSVSTVDVADLPSGVITVVLAAREQRLGRTGHYGALTGADAPAPELPLR